MKRNWGGQGTERWQCSCKIMGREQSPGTGHWSGERLPGKARHDGFSAGSGHIGIASLQTTVQWCPGARVGSRKADRT